MKIVERPAMAEADPVRRRLLQTVTGASALLLLNVASSNARADTLDAATFTLPEATEAITPFKVDVPQDAIDDLKSRLRIARLPEQETVEGWTQGVPLSEAKALIAYWRDQYDWRRFEKQINAFPQYRTKIDGLGFHFIHVKSKHENALPMILTHGWPGSIVEFLKVIGPLTNPTAYGGKAEDAFHVVIPSLPGFGFSDRPDAEGWKLPRIANAWATLMKRLGYTRWTAQGGDWGTAVTHTLAHMRPEGLVAAHVNWPLVYPDKLPSNPSPDEKAAIDAVANFFDDQYGYFKQQATRPQTIGYALADSPVGLAMYIYEKFQAWSDNRGKVEDALTIDEVLDDISIYWFTNTGASSARIYWENGRGGPGFNAGQIVLPMAASIFPREIFRAPKSWGVVDWPNLIYWNEVDRGGHFAAFEQPQLFTEELRKAFRTIRTGLD
ncbi:alpha/beta fold hydrolase [Ensifer sp. ENS04]|uniref:epoxide hydrolase family protein n=1 Tax=Ensifer sp. ENS04 TaxID=2769281 RepID=UPI00178536D1|nr:epoxide hydrolase [Ensifer sp. ENS04]MBD9541375.1 alpha/beta fold hydrolase [Ensifer sp. ENS04]